MVGLVHMVSFLGTCPDLFHSQHMTDEVEKHGIKTSPYPLQ